MISANTCPWTLLSRSSSLLAACTVGITVCGIKVLADQRATLPGGAGPLPSDMSSEGPLHFSREP